MHTDNEDGDPSGKSLAGPGTAKAPLSFEHRHGCVLWWDFIGPFYRYSVWTEGLWVAARMQIARRDRDFQFFRARSIDAPPEDASA